MSNYYLAFHIQSHGEPDIHRLLNRLRGTYKEKNEKRKENCIQQQEAEVGCVNDEKKFEAAGHLMGELAEVVIHTTTPT